MPIYRFEIDGVGGSIGVRHIKAGNEWDAQEQLGLPRGKIRSFRRDILKEIDEALPKPKPKLTEQAYVLAVFSAQVTSGSNPAKVMDRLIENVPSMARHKDAVKAHPKVSDKIRIMGFDPQLQLLAEVGEQSGMIGEVLGTAADEIIERQKLMAAVKKEMIPAGLIAALGILIMFVLPIFVYEPIVSIRNARGIVMPENVATHFLVYIGVLMDGLMPWVIFTSICAGSVLTARLWWPFIRGLPLLNKIENFFQLQHGYYFISAFLPMFSRGVSITKTVEMMRDFSKGSARTAFMEIEAHLANGGAISKSFQSQYWEVILRDCMSGFDEMRLENKIGLLQRVQPLMGQIMKQSGERIAGVVSTIGLLLAVGVTMVVFVGLTVPLMTISTPMG